jgi:hypothetical protein
MWYKYPEEDGAMRMLLGSCLVTIALGLPRRLAYIVTHATALL